MQLSKEQLKAIESGVMALRNQGWRTRSQVLIDEAETLRTVLEKCKKQTGN